MSGQTRLIVFVTLILASTHSPGQALPRRAAPSSIQVTLSGPTRLRQGSSPTFRIEVRNASGRPVMLCKHPSFVAIDAVGGSFPTLTDDAYDMRGEVEADWVVLRPGQRLAFYEQRRVAAGAFGAAAVHVSLASTGSAQLRPRLRARVLRKVVASGAAWLPQGVRSKGMRVSFG